MGDRRNLDMTGEIVGECHGPLLLDLLVDLEVRRRPRAPNQLGNLAVAQIENNLCCLNANFGGLRLVTCECRETLEQFVGASLPITISLLTVLGCERRHCGDLSIGLNY